MAGREIAKLDRLLEQAEKKLPLSREELVFLLHLEDPDQINQLFATARKLRSSCFGDKIFLYGFVYFSTYCRNNCSFCLYRSSNDISLRYRKKESEILETSYRVADCGVHLLDLTMGEDPEYFSQGEKGFEQLIHMVDLVKKSTGLPLMISPGVVPEHVLKMLKEAGADWYACYQETHNRDLYAKLRLGQSFDDRIKKKHFARSIGLLVEEGLLTGIGDEAKDVAYSLEAMKKMDVDQARVMSFVPQKGTPMAGWNTPSRLRELKIIAVMRLLFPDRLIPASLDVDGIVGLKQRLDAGANVVTSIIPPREGLAGVSNCTPDIEDGNRNAGRVREILEECGLRAAKVSEYARWVTERQNSIKDQTPVEAVI